MSAVDALSQTNSSSPTAASGFSSLSAEDFSKIIFTELSKQDPLQPNDTNALLQQISSIRAIQSDMDLTTNLKSLVNQNEFASASTLIGKTVSGIDDQRDRVTGVVKSVSRTANGTVLTLDSGERMSISDLDQIINTTPPTNPPPPPPPPPPNNNVNPTNPANPNGGVPNPGLPLGPP
jgi:flagellar basal-body rod modification protein FlgD